MGPIDVRKQRCQFSMWSVFKVAVLSQNDNWECIPFSLAGATASGGYDDRGF